MAGDSGPEVGSRASRGAARPARQGRLNDVLKLLTKTAIAPDQQWALSVLPACSTADTPR